MKAEKWLDVLATMIEARDAVNRLVIERDELARQVEALNRPVLKSEWQEMQQELKLMRNAIQHVVFGWRERDHPEGFCRSTAESIANDVAHALFIDGNVDWERDKWVGKSEQ